MIILELAARSIGGLCARALRFGAGVSLEEVIIRHALGMGLDGLTRESQASGVMMLPIRSAGVLDHVSGQERALAIEGVVGLDITYSVGAAGGATARRRSLPGVHLRPGTDTAGGRNGPSTGRGMSRRAPALSQA